jgi:hypothetical protein
MLRISLGFLALAAVLGLIGGFGVGGCTWEAVRTPVVVLAYLPISTLAFVSFRKSFGSGSQSAVRGFMCVLLIYAVLAFLV